MRPDSFVLSSTNRALGNGLRRKTSGTMPNAILLSAPAFDVVLPKDRRLVSIHIGYGPYRRARSRSIKAQLLRPLLRNRTDRTNGTYGPHESYKPWGDKMLAVVAILLLLWLYGLTIGLFGNMIHLLLIIALVALVFYAPSNR